MSDAAYADDLQDDDIPEDDLEEGFDGEDEASPEGSGQGEGEQGQQRQALTPEEYERRHKSMYRAMKRDRDRFRALQREVEDLRRGGGQQRQQREEDDTPPDPEQDPIGALAWQQRQIRAYQEQQAEEGRQTEAQRAQAARIERLTADLVDDETEFRRQKPDYDQAAAFFRTARAEELAATGMSPGQVQQALAAELISMAERAISADRSPSEIVYSLAAKRGYKPNIDRGAERLQTISRGQAAGRSLSQGAARSGDGNALTPDAIAKLPGKEFDKAFDRFRAQERRGGRR